MFETFTNGIDRNVNFRKIQIVGKKYGRRACRRRPRSSRRRSRPPGSTLESYPCRVSRDREVVARHPLAPLYGAHSVAGSSEVRASHKASERILGRRMASQDHRRPSGGLRASWIGATGSRNMLGVLGTRTQVRFALWQRFLWIINP